MAANGIPAIVDGVVSGLNALRGAGGPRVRGIQAVEGASGQSAAGDSALQRNFVNVDGQVLDRNAPRGTYLNITA